jgi:hypothetical protein
LFPICSPVVIITPKRMRENCDISVDRVTLLPTS